MTTLTFSQKAIASKEFSMHKTVPGLMNIEGNEVEVSIKLSRLVTWSMLLGC